MNRSLVFALIALGTVSAAGACAPDEGMVALSAEHRSPVAVFVGIDPITVAQPFGLLVQICATNQSLPERIEVDAEMPAHKHGINYDPVVKRRQKDLFEATNLLFHMPGAWRLWVTTHRGATATRHSLDLTVK